ncbi:MAG: TlpA disulfide reductase family protein [Candidatus Margulisiibacteriota bacterium]|nr:TlpA family protein disulfide reductase [Candidatus Margulisiibacteriota bacterium]
MRIALAILISLTFTLTGFAMGELPKAGSSAPAAGVIDFALPDLAGNRVSIEELRGKVVFINFWATWCPPCAAEMPAMQRLYEKMDKRKFEMLAVNEDRGGAPVIKRFLGDKNYTFKILLDINNNVAYKYNITFFPTTFIIDKQGEVAATMIGAREWDSQEMIKTLNELIAK